MTPDQQEEADLVSVVHIVLSLISAICCLAVLATSLRVRALRKFPANMLLWKTFCDLVTSALVVGINTAMLSMEGDHLANGAKICSDGIVAGIVRACPSVPRPQRMSVTASAPCFLTHIPLHS